MFAVCDGHGQFGRQASLFVKMIFTKYVAEKIQRAYEDESIKAYRTTGSGTVAAKASQRLISEALRSSSVRAH